MRVFLFTFILAASCMHLSHLSLVANLPDTQKVSRSALPSIDAIRLISLNYENIAADYYWFRALSHFGIRENHAFGYPNLRPFLERILELDPYFELAYYFAGTALTTTGPDEVDASIRLLLPGIQYVPDYEYVPMLLGFNYYFYKQDFKNAAKYFAIAAKDPDCPPNVVSLATRLSAEISNPAMGIAIIDAILDKTSDEKLIKSYTDRRLFLQLEIELQYIQEKIEHHNELANSPASVLSDLLQSGQLRALPPHDPVGGSYYIDEAGNAATTSEEKRLRLPKSVKKRLRNP